MTFLQRDFLSFSQPFPLIYPSGSKTLLNFFLEVEVTSMLHHLTEPLTIVDALPLQQSHSASVIPSVWITRRHSLL